MGLFKRDSRKREGTSIQDGIIGKSKEQEESVEKGKPQNRNVDLNEESIKLSKNIQVHLRSGNLGLYACDLYSLSEILRKEKRYKGQLEVLIDSAYIHLSGVNIVSEYFCIKENGFKIAKPHPCLPPAVIRSTGIVLKRLDMTLEDYKTLYRSKVDVRMTPDHVFGLEKSLEIICEYLNGNQEKADKMIKQGVKKFIAEINC